METQTILIWIITGFIGWMILQYLLNGELTIRDILIALILSWFGLVVLVFSLIMIIVTYFDNKGTKLKDILDKRIL